ncbi:MAG: hypothetical protein WC882_01310 [Candidatus Gracilibacteria bacterium]
MKILYLAGAAVFFVTILILGFENIGASCNYLTFFFWELSTDTSPTIIFFAISLLGGITGVFVTMAAVSLLGGNEEDEEGDDFEA